MSTPSHPVATRLTALLQQPDLDRALETMGNLELVGLISELEQLNPNDVVCEIDELARAVAYGRFRTEVELQAAEGGGESR